MNTFEKGKLGENLNLKCPAKINNQIIKNGG